jgi:hypothetical protein
MIQYIKNLILKFTYHVDISKLRFAVLRSQKDFTKLLLRQVIIQRKVDSLEKRIEHLEKIFLKQ